MSQLMLYGDPFAVATRFVTCTLECLGLEYGFKYVDVRNGEHLAAAFEKVNPLKSVPCLVDGTFTLTESRAIAAYLANQYGGPANANGVDLYPSIPSERARVDEMLYYDANTINRRYQELMTPILFGQSAKEDSRNSMFGLLHGLNRRVGQTGFMAGSEAMTLADLAVLVTLTTLDATKVIDLSPYQDLLIWMMNCEKLVPNYAEANEKGMNEVVRFCQSKVGNLESV